MPVWHDAAVPTRTLLETGWHAECMLPAAGNVQLNERVSQQEEHDPPVNYTGTRYGNKWDGNIAVGAAKRLSRPCALHSG